MRARGESGKREWSRLTPGLSLLAQGNLSVLATSNAMPDYVNRLIEHTQVRLFDPGVTTGTPRSDFALSGLPTSRFATVVFTEGGTAFMVAPCP